jgi:hypothetical protein
VNNVIADAGRVDYIDKDGIQRRVLLPSGITDASEGIPLSLPVDSLFTHCSLEFRRALIEELWARGLVEPGDYLKPGAAELVSAALRSVVKLDALDILALAREEKRNGRS